MKDITTIGIDIAKNFIQLHGATKEGKCLLKKRIARDSFLGYMANLPPCLVGMEACGGAHHWARELTKLGFEAKLMSPQKVKKFVENHKNDAKDAEACAEAVVRKNMRFVSIKTTEQMEGQALHRVRSYYVKQRTGLMNMIRGLLAEEGIAISKSQVALEKKLKVLLSEESEKLSKTSKEIFSKLRKDLDAIEEHVEECTAEVKALSKNDENCQRLETINGIGPITATALVAKIGNGSEFKKGRELAAFLGLVPKQNSSGDRQQLLGISKHGDRYLRQLLIHGGRACVKAALQKNKETNMYRKNDAHSCWIRQLVERRGANKASVAVANKNARMAIAVLKNRNRYDVNLAHRGQEAAVL